MVLAATLNLLCSAGGDPLVRVVLLPGGGQQPSWVADTKQPMLVAEAPVYDLSEGCMEADLDVPDGYMMYAIQPCLQQVLPALLN